MKKLLTIFFVSLFCGVVFAPGNEAATIFKAEASNPYERLWEAVCLVESGGNASAYNQKERAVGIAQIRQIRVSHYNKLAGKYYKLIDCYDRNVSKSIFMYFCWGRDFETVAKEWNGSGEKTVQYWKKVKQQLNKL